MKKEGKISGLMKDIKNIVRFSSDEDFANDDVEFRDDYEIEDYKKELYNDYEEEVAEEEPKAKNNFKSFFSRMKKDNKESSYQEESEEYKDEEYEDDEMSSYASTIIFTLKNFEDCRKVSQHIKNNKMITLNFERVDANTKQRILDFLSGAMEVKNAAYAEVSKTVYTIVPERMKIHFEGAKKSQNRIINVEREDN